MDQFKKKFNPYNTNQQPTVSGIVDGYRSGKRPFIIRQIEAFANALGDPNLSDADKKKLEEKLADFMNGR